MPTTIETERSEMIAAILKSYSARLRADGVGEMDRYEEVEGERWQLEGTELNELIRQYGRECSVGVPF